MIKKGDDLAKIGQAVILCSALESVAPYYGCHVALTGGCLYKAGELKDIDIVVYRIRQWSRINQIGLLRAFSELGLIVIKDFGFCIKCDYYDTPVDLLFPGNNSGNYGNN